MCRWPGPIGSFSLPDSLQFNPSLVHCGDRPGMNTCHSTGVHFHLHPFFGQGGGHGVMAGKWFFLLHLTQIVVHSTSLPPLKKFCRLPSWFNRAILPNLKCLTCLTQPGSSVLRLKDTVPFPPPFLKASFSTGNSAFPAAVFSPPPRNSFSSYVML